MTVRVLITGGAGFQGSHLTDLWARSGHQVTVLSTYSEHAEQNLEEAPDGVSIVWGSVTDAEVVTKSVRGHDLVVHMAAHINVDESRVSPRVFVEVNIGGTLNVLEAVRETGARLIHASSCEVYGSVEGGSLKESAEFRPHSPYAASKAGADRLCFAYQKTFDVNVTIMRPCNVYGERQRAGRGGALIPIFASLAAEGEPLTVFGTGDQQREYIHVRDLVRAYDLVAKRDDTAGLALNVGTGQTHSVREIADYISAKADVPVTFGPARPGEVDRFVLDSSRIHALGFEPEVSFEDGLSEYLDWRLQPRSDAG